MQNRPLTSNVAREAVALLTTLAIVVGGGFFLYTMAHASPGERTVELQQPAPNIVPVSAAAGRVTRTKPLRSRRATRVRYGRLPALGRVQNWMTLGFQWPVVGSHQITSPFGPRDDGFHHGADIGCAIGQPLYASRAGRVFGAGDAGPGYGLVVMIDHGSGYQTLYGHMSKLEVQPGQFVRTRQEIGLCGETGNATGPHVHFEVRFGGYVWDPVRFLP